MSVRDKQRLTIIKSIKSQEGNETLTDEEAWDIYKQQRYHTVEAKANQLKAASAGGKKSGNRPFKDPEVARKASLKSHYGEGKYSE